MPFFDLYNYWIFILLMMIGLYTVIAKPNLVKKVIGLSLLQTAIFLFFLSLGKVTGGTAPVVVPSATLYSNPLPHALMLTAIVVSVSTMAVALAIIVNIKQTYGTVEEDEIQEAEGD
ncbi:MAG: cation:proton antiporter subunit C [Deltaproteobacteria bacterium]|nr:cation:proton antiporter subunit C [Deltaproteobacteria bacterium]MCZ6623232.1 cation:proton antiporter subunit C [Deltaproteobacteria bacterium]